MATVAATASKGGDVPKDVKLPPIERFTTKDGLGVIAVARGPLPLVSLRLVIRAGSAMDPPGKAGLADFTARVMRRGTKKLSADQIDEAIEFVGAQLGIGVSEDGFSCSISAPADKLDDMLQVMAQLIREPSFPEAEVQSAKSRTLAQLANDMDDPATVADRAFTKALWGDHPYAHDPGGNKQDIQSFTRDDLVRFHKERLGPKISTLFVVGAIDPEKLKVSVDKAFAGWTGGPTEVAPPPTFKELPNAGQIIVVDKPEQTQSQVRIGGIGMRKGHEDSIPSVVMNTSLGGGFTSRLVNEVRVNRGLSYGVGSYFAGLAAGGYFEISTFTKNETTKEIIDVALAEVAKVKQKGLTPRELKTAKTYVSGLYPLRLETNEAVGGSLADIWLYGLGNDWVEKYRSRVAEVTPARVNEVSQRYLALDKPLIVVVGKASAIVPQLKAFGPVKVLKVAELE
ncbi:MAG: M16 family metallopeptidase [Myxococcaceae bacterium]